MTANPTSRSVAHIANAVRTAEGDGMTVRRGFPTRALDSVDPFLLLDEMGPLELPAGSDAGFPDHPHRGFETVTYLLEGAFEHRDSAGHAGRIGPGDVQWMTAGSGLVHSEMPAADLRRAGGRLHGFQLWVNLPRRDKMIAPRYQEIPAARLPVGTSADGLVTARVIAGEALGARAVIDTRTPIELLHLRLRPGGSILQPVPPDHGLFAYVFGGEGRFGRGGERAREGQLVSFEADGERAAISADAEAPGALEVLLVGGAPMREPVARYGPFVMNEPREIQQAFADFRSGRMGAIAR